MAVDAELAFESLTEAENGCGGVPLVLLRQLLRHALDPAHVVKVDYQQNVACDNEQYIGSLIAFQLGKSHELDQEPNRIAKCADES
eukprot:CAMPEP_0170462824 /NCGR_PEP_ID=MMETSP0123-20130129/8175_1 /TAXON_ID=182087 /ORGANISM="Favella ehrenbergii, Strain Fehren 1" /LENGTH=85 /DNA_ID=CAMNT_0010728121 /DNA_START=482 /DNA_END=738 /DNA_ORIENTATION=-